MDADGLPIIGPSVDYQKVEPINQKRMVTFVNHFLVHTAGFLNRFSSVCENKLAHLSTRVHRLETQMTLLEGKLSSVPGLDQVSVSTSSVNQPTSSATQQSSQQNLETSPMRSTLPSGSDIPSTPSAAPSQNTGTSPSQEPEERDIEPASTSSNTVKVKQDPRYAKYFRMMSVGVPSMAVKQKMILEGLNAGLLDTPEAPLPDDHKVAAAPSSIKDEDSDFSIEEENQSSDDSSVDFSD